MKKHTTEKAARLLTWYDEHARLLPWRADQNPYAIWISEIMLQQTQVATVIPYFERFMARCPTVRHLAELDDASLMKLWEGLGYYRRAHHLKATAETVCRVWDGRLPESYRELLTLPGIGPYTAGAIASIAFGERVPAVDGNVFRILSRVHADETAINLASARKHYTALANDLVPAHRPGDFNQALMDLGAGICLANGAPHCDVCPWENFCLARRRSLQDVFPVKIKKPPRKEERRSVFIFRHGSRVFLQQRPARGLLANLWEFVNVPKIGAADFMAQHRITPIHIADWGESEHLFTHIKWRMHGYAVRLDTAELPFDGRWVNARELQTAYAMPKALRAYRRQFLEENTTEETP